MKIIKKSYNMDSIGIDRASFELFVSALALGVFILGLLIGAFYY